LAAVELPTVQVTKLPLQHKIRKVAMICFAKPVLTEDLYIEQVEEYSIIAICEIPKLEKDEAYS
jgi:hypothetical protein